MKRIKKVFTNFIYFLYKKSWDVPFWVKYKTTKNCEDWYYSFSDGLGYFRGYYTKREPRDWCDKIQSKLHMMWLRLI